MDGITHYETFDIDPLAGGVQEQFEDAFLDAAKSINDIYGDEDLTLDYDAENAATDQFRLISSSGRTIGLEGFEIRDAADAPIVVPPAYSIEFSGNGTPAVPLAALVGRGAGTSESAVVTGTLTIETDPGITIASSLDGAAGGLFATNRPASGSSIITLGGKDGYHEFTGGDNVTFTVDGTHNVTVTVPGAAITELDFANALYAGLTTSLPPLSTDDYSIIRNGLSISIMKNKDLETPIEITDFTEAGTGDARLAVKTGTGRDTSSPENDLLESGNPLRNFSTSSLYEDDGIILWEKYDTNGFFTGEKGLINVEDEEQITITDKYGRELLQFDISAGSLAAGNTLSININKVPDPDPAGAPGAVKGIPDPLNFTIRDNANSQNEIYHFKVAAGGTVGILPGKDENGKDEKPITIEWDNGLRSGTFEIEDHDPPLTPSIPVEIEVDGMTLMFTSGTLFKGDVFTITTDESGIPLSTNNDGDPTGELLSDWHWTLDSFADQFNKKGQGMTASVNSDNQLELSASDEYHVINNMKYSEDNGFVKENISIEVNDWAAMDFEAETLLFSRTASGSWNIANDPTGGNAVFLPDGADDDNVSVDFTGDGLADITVSFKEKPSGEGFLSFDLVKHDANDIGFAFSDASGMIAAAGINTFFKGDSAMTMELNETLQDTNFVAAATLDSETGKISKGDNTNTLALANVQFKSLTMRQWSFSRGEDSESSIATATLDGYYGSMLGALGVDSRNIQSDREFSSLMVNYITEERDAVSAVSLDEEMIKMMEYQHAFTAASKLVSVTDEMLNTIIGLR